jgi:hypothetical protein
MLAFTTNFGKRVCLILSRVILGSLTILISVQPNADILNLFRYMLKSKGFKYLIA